MRTLAGGKVVMTPGVAELLEERLTQVLKRVRRFDEFTSDNDPHSDHDFGSNRLLLPRHAERLRKSC
jgi:hypothetical protein